ncbi:hypothetical protein K701_21260 [Streptomyces fradiae ATCC 10745 = DSM 40063]|uniref:Uncharacterized protein n=1 Tax=Streptomyces fradiae ATCC 10745 = DSM 40063 TaxID=1319510 RepID=A0ABQ6XQE2_STRFR|nr:hypothetical protein K701_21260 [Streptomyces fradiae ATCC 10745 = DSM 40063]
MSGWPFGRTCSFAHTVLPGAAWRGLTPQSSARAVTRSRPRPDSESGSVARGLAGGRFSVRVSVTSMWKMPSVRVSWTRKSRPGTRPWRTALAVSSAVMRVRVSLIGLL